MLEPIQSKFLKRLRDLEFGLALLSKIQDSFQDRTFIHFDRINIPELF